MGSLMRDQRWMIMDKNSPPSPLIPFQQRQNNRSPLESPPIAKKLPRVKDTGGSGGNNIFFDQMFVDSSPTSEVFRESVDCRGGKENRSILKKGRGGQGHASRSVRRVDFDQDVVVYHFDRIEGGHVSSESQRLSSDVKDRKEFVNRTLHGRSKSITIDTQAAKISSLFGNREPPIQYAVPLPVTSQYSDQVPSTSQYLSSSVPLTSRQYAEQSLPVSTLDRRVQEHPVEHGHGTEVDFSFFEDDQHRLRLKFTIALGEGVAANDVLVKANTTGNKVRLVGTRTIGQSRQGTIIRQEFTERYQLPMDVDPYMITARMDNTGNLYVEAPVMTPDHRRALSVERQTTAAAAGINSDARIGAISSDFVL